jgi:serine/threonine-protein kinase PknG
MTSCAQGGCTGDVQDGYCNVCGMAAQVSLISISAASIVNGGSAVSSGGVSAVSAPSGRTSGRTGSGRTGSRRGSTGTTRRGMLGAGLVEVPPVPYRDPATAILPDPEVPEHKRFCSHCGDPVGRGRDGQSARPSGFCRKCGTRYSFTPKLAPGDLVGGQYEVLGCLAHGGLGWIYLARDRNVSDRWVVLKGLLDSGDADAMAAALAERQFLARVEHPNIVKIYNFVQHPEPDTGLLVGYIVMEYVGGQSLKEMAQASHGADGRHAPMPPGQAIAYALEVLRALGYLHGLGLVYCDFKPDNVIQSEEQLKLIDLGGVRRIDDDEGPIYGTVGYQAPEIATDGPSVRSDLYTVARALAVLTFDFKGYTGEFAKRLPDRASVPLLTRFESFDRLLRRATDPDPGGRFGSAAEMADQLTGVLREILAAEDGEPRPAASAVFGPELRTAGPGLGDVLGSYPPAPPRAREVVAALPVPLVDSADPAAGYLAGLGAAAPDEIVRLLSHPPVSSPEVSLQLAGALIGTGELLAAGDILSELAAADQDDWRVGWYRAMTRLVCGDRREATRSFEEIYSLFPGEIAPKLALAAAAELAGDLQTAARYYELAWRADHSYVSAAFGLARVRLALGDRPGAVGALDSVPAGSIHFIQAQVAAIAARVRGRVADAADPSEVIEAGQRLEALGLDAERRERLEAEVLQAALDWVIGHATPNGAPAAGRQSAAAPTATGPDGRVLGTAMTERDLRTGLERAYRTLAHLAASADQRIALVERANSVRPRTLV